MAAQVGFAPTPARLTGGGTTVIRLSNEWSGRRELHSRPPRSKRSRLLLTIRPKMALSMGLAPTAFPQTTGCFSIQLRERKSEMVGSAGNAPVRRFRLCFAIYSRAVGSLPCGLNWRFNDSLGKQPQCADLSPTSPSFVVVNAFACAILRFAAKYYFLWGTDMIGLNCLRPAAGLVLGWLV